jgi:hypothetical protein
LRGPALILSLIPTPADLVDLAAVWAAGLVLLLWGRVLTLGRGAVEVQTIAGWGGFAIVLTLWGIFLPEPLWWPVAGITAVALAAALTRGLALRREELTALLRIMALALPIWAIMLTARPSQPDTFLNLLPNAAYLYDHGLLPTDARPPSHSFLPGAPYNLQFWAYLAGAALPELPASAMVHINVLLHLLVGLLFARVAQSLGREGAGAPGWGACGLGILLATALNPGFVPRIYFAAYGEASIAACLAISGWLAAQSLSAVAERGRTGYRLWSLALALAALVNIKQESVAFVAALALTIGVLGLLDRQVRFWRMLVRFLPAFLPAVGLYLVWRWFVLNEFSVGELKLLPFDQWHWDVLPQVLSRIGVIVVEKVVFFAFMLLALGLMVVRIRRRGLDMPSRLLALLVGTCVLYNVFLLLTYVAHFNPEMSADAHSFFRYNTHLSLLLVLALATLARAVFEERGWAPSWGRRRLAASLLVLAGLAVPIVFAERLRFDLVMPQPLVRALGHELGALLKRDEKFALILPGDNNSVAVMLQSVLRYEAPRLPSAEPTIVSSFDDRTLSRLEGQGISKVFVSCTPEGNGSLPARRALLLTRAPEGWKPAAVWRYPDPNGTRWTPMLSAAALCR